MMQTQPPEINWLALLLPSLIVAGTTILVQILIAFKLSKVTAKYQKEISKEIEDYKKDISKDLENHKIQLQSDFQTKFYEFQTRYSVLYRERAEVIKKIYSLLTKMESELTQFHFDSLLETEIYKDDDLLKRYEELTDYIAANRIFFSKEITQNLKLITGAIGHLLLAIGEIRENKEFMRAIKENREYEINEFRERWKITEIIGNPIETAFNKVNKEIPNLMRLLETEFRHLLSVENPDHQIEKKSS